MDESRYAKRVQAQITQYAGVENMHALPDISGYWRAKFVRDAVRNVFGVERHLDFYAKPFLAAVQKTGNSNLVSIGAGDGAIELGVAKIMRQAGAKFRFHLLELSPIQIARGRRNAAEAGLTSCVTFIEADINTWKPSEEYAGVMAHHSLHHVQNLEGLFDEIKQSLLGCFCTMDMIGRNGHMRWPEVLQLVQLFWAIIPPEKRKHKVLPNFEQGFYNHDCSKEGFEGIRAQDILPCLVERFGFQSFYAFGGLIDPFISRGFGHHYDSKNDWDRSFIDLVGTLNDILIECGHIKPTQMHAIMTTDMDVTPKTYRGRTPTFCIRSMQNR
jgi:hypothetical protein